MKTFELILKIIPPAYSTKLIQTFKNRITKEIINDNVKSSTVDLRIDFETDTVIPEKTSAYCLILHDQIITYNPFSGDVRK
ncbi:hypothetical protein PSTG_20052, partial [Puccinia striiformis f. sp. tritici PST-78]